MTSIRNFMAMAVIALIAIAPSAAMAKGKLGFKAKTTVSGFFRPTIKTVTILEIAPGTPASAAGLEPGDRVMKVNGEKVEGAPARKILAMIKNAEPGQHIEFTVQRGDKVITADLVVRP